MAENPGRGRGGGQEGRRGTGVTPIKRERRERAAQALPPDRGRGRGRGRAGINRGTGRAPFPSRPSAPIPSGQRIAESLATDIEALHLENPYHGHPLPIAHFERWDHGNAIEGRPEFWYKETTETKDGTEFRNKAGKLYPKDENGVALDVQAPEKVAPPLYTDSIIQTAPLKRFERYGVVHDDVEFLVGHVICAVEHRTDNDLNPPDKYDRYRTDTVYGPVFTKERKFIVIKKFPDFCITVPIFTQHGRGLAARPLAERHLFVAVRDYSHINTPQWRDPQNDNGYVLSYRVPQFREEVTGQRIQPFHIMHNQSNIYFAYPVCFRYATPCIIEAQLEPASFAHLVDLIIDYGLNGCAANNSAFLRPGWPAGDAEYYVPEAQNY